MNFRLIFFTHGILLVTLAAAMLIPLVLDVMVSNPDWQSFLAAAAITLFTGASLMLVNKGAQPKMNLRTGFLLTGSSWVVLSVFASLPFFLSDLGISLTDSVFEAVSGITTTGSTVLVGLDNMPPGLLMWRALLQWMGGIGIIVLAISILPMLQIGGMQLFYMESSENSEKALPRTAQIIASIGIIYLILTCICALLYATQGMSWFDAMAHAMTTIATGGFSTHDLSMGYFDTLSIEITAITFMLLGGLPFVLYLKGFQGNWKPLFEDSQVRFFITLVMITIAVLSTYLTLAQDMEAKNAVRATAFNAVSVITGTGYATADYGLWGSFAAGSMYFLMFVGGCAGSTTCGIKIFRIQVLYETARLQIRRLLQPHGVFIPYYNGKPISESILLSVTSFFFFYAVSFIVLALILKLFNLDFVTAFSGAATAISNVGPGLGPIIGPSGNFLPLPDGAKWAMSAGMLLGRLELFTVLVLFSPRFWRH